MGVRQAMSEKAGKWWGGKWGQVHQLRVAVKSGLDFEYFLYTLRLYAYNEKHYAR